MLSFMLVICKYYLFFFTESWERNQNVVGEEGGCCCCLSFSGTANCLSTKRPFVTQCRSGPHLSQCHIRSSLGYFSPLNLFSNICLQTSGCVTNIPTVTLPFGQFRCRASESAAHSHRTCLIVSGTSHSLQFGVSLLPILCL